jgi:hypothetical protein
VSRTNVYRDGRVHVQQTKCSTCIYRPGNLMHLEPGRKDGMEADAIRDQGVIPCHQTLDGDHSVCRGFFDVAKHEGLLSAAERLDIITWTPVRGRIFP